MKRVILILGVFGLLLASCQKLDIAPNDERRAGDRTMVDEDGNIVGDQDESITDPNNDEDEDEVIGNGITDPNNDEDEDAVANGK